jgi:polyisoprenoid-binding protein YceI
MIDRGKGEYTVSGNLNLHGVTRSISFPARIALPPGKATVETEFVINRKDFGITYPGMPDNLIRDDVVIFIRIDAAR